MQIEGTSFSMTFLARGYDTKVDDPQQPHTDAPTRKLVTKVTGPGE